MKGKIESMSEKTKGMKVGGEWFNLSPEDFAKYKKGQLVQFEADQNKDVLMISLDEAVPVKLDGLPEPILAMIANYGKVMEACKKETDRVFAQDPAYKASIGQHCNSLFIAVIDRMGAL